MTNKNKAERYSKPEEKQIQIIVISNFFQICHSIMLRAVRVYVTRSPKWPVVESVFQYGHNCFKSYRLDW